MVTLSTSAIFSVPSCGHSLMSDKCVRVPHMCDTALSQLDKAIYVCALYHPSLQLPYAVKSLVILYERERESTYLVVDSLQEWWSSYTVHLVANGFSSLYM